MSPRRVRRPRSAWKRATRSLGSSEQFIRRRRQHRAHSHGNALAEQRKPVTRLHPDTTGWRQGEMLCRKRFGFVPSGSHFRRQRSACGVTMAADQNVSGLRGGNEGQACVLLRPVSAPSLHADMGRLAPALPANLRPVDAGEACDRLGGVRNNADGPVWTERNADGGVEIAFCHDDLVRIVEVRRPHSLRRDGEKSVDRKFSNDFLSAQTALSQPRRCVVLHGELSRLLEARPGLFPLLPTRVLPWIADIFRLREAAPSTTVKLR